MTAWHSYQRRLLAAVLLLACAWLGHGILLRGFARVLVEQQSPDSAGYIWLNSVGPAFDECVRLYQENPTRRILLVEMCPGRAVQVHAKPSLATSRRRVLLAQGVPPQAITVIDGCARDAWQEVRLIHRWCQEHPDAQVVALCGRFSSAYCRRIVDALFAPGESQRVRVFGVPGADYDETDWWRSRRGVRDVLFGYLRLAHALLSGPEPQTPELWTLQQYQQVLAERIPPRSLP